MEIDYKTFGFYDNATIAFHLKGIFDKYEDSFPGAESVQVVLRQVFPEDIGKGKTTFSDDGKKIYKEIVDCLRHVKGIPVEAPGQEETLKNIKNAMDALVKQYNKKFVNKIEEKPTEEGKDKKE